MRRAPPSARHSGVKLLFDQNLSRHLVGMLSIEYPESRHVTEMGLDVATDAEIWTYAREHDFVIVSKDSDFRQLAFLHGPPPKAIWVTFPDAAQSARATMSLRAGWVYSRRPPASRVRRGYGYWKSVTRRRGPS